MTRTIKVILYTVIGMFTFAFYSIFSHDLGTSDDNPLNEYTVYQKVGISKLVNHKLKEDVQDVTQSTSGLLVSNKPSSSGDYTSYQVSSESRASEVWEIIKKYASMYQTDAVFLATICSLESEFGRSNTTYTPDGYVGLMQVGQAPVDQLQQWGLWGNGMTTDRIDDDNNMHIATAYLKKGYDVFIDGKGYQDEISAWAAGYNSWWDRTRKYNPPYLPNSGSRDPQENKRYYYMARMVYDSYISGAKKIGDSKDWARQKYDSGNY